jgi:uncharacterized membrane protein YesL
VLLVIFDLPFYDLIEISLKLVFKHPAWTLLLMGMTALFLFVGVQLPAALIIFALFSGTAWLVSWGAWRIIRLYEAELHSLTI